MSNDLISRKSLKIIIEQNQLVNAKLSVYDILEIIDNAPTVELFCAYLSDGDVRQPCVEAPCEYERPTGEWVGDTDYASAQGYYEAYKCSNCGYGIHWRDYHLTKEYKFCPECGARMRGGEE